MSDDAGSVRPRTPQWWDDVAADRGEASGGAPFARAEDDQAPGAHAPGAHAPGTEAPGTQGFGTQGFGTQALGTMAPSGTGAGSGPDAADTDGAGADEPGADQPDVDQPDADQPDADQPDADQPDADQPRDDESRAAAEAQDAGPGEGHTDPALPVRQGPLALGRDLSADVDRAGPLRGHDPSRRRRGVLTLVLVTASLLVGLVGGVAGGWLADRDRARPGLSSSPALTAPPAGSTLRPPDSVAGIAAAVLPSVVSIQASSTGLEGTGSGFVVDPDGLVLTNNHVVAQAADDGEIVVVFADGSQEPAEVVGRTTPYDLAVLRVERSGLPALTLGDSDAVVVGDPVIAVGAPLGLESTVTTGIVSALNRPVSAGNGQQGEAAFINAIQTDAAINPGNSGGPLVDGAGRVVGVNSAIASSIGGGQTGSIGLGFAIPSNQAARTAAQLVDEGKATYPVIGVLLDRRYTGEGVKVVDEASERGPAVTPDGPAERAGVEAGDVITTFEGRPVTDPDELIVAIRARAPGDTVSLTVRRDGSEQQVELKLDEAVSN